MQNGTVCFFRFRQFSLNNVRQQGEMLMKTSNLHEMGFDPVSSRRNFTLVKDQDYFKP